MSVLYFRDYSSTIKCTHPDFINSQTITQSRWNSVAVLGKFQHCDRSYFGTYQGEIHVNIYDGDRYLKAGQWKNNKVFKEWC